MRLCAVAAPRVDINQMATRDGDQDCKKVGVLQQDMARTLTLAPEGHSANRRRLFRRPSQKKPLHRAHSSSNHVEHDGSRGKSLGMHWQRVGIKMTEPLAVSAILKELPADSTCPSHLPKQQVLETGRVAHAMHRVDRQQSEAQAVRQAGCSCTTWRTVQ